MDCECQEKVFDHENYCNYCVECGKMFDICPTIVLNDYQLYKQEGYYLKPVLFNRIKHFRKWIYLILGQSAPNTIPWDIINILKKEKRIY